MVQLQNWITRDRFIEIGRYLHFVDNLTSVQPGSNRYDHLGKVRPVLEHISGQFTSLYNLNRGCNSDEAIIPFKGWSSMKENILKKNYKAWIQGMDNGRYQKWFVSRFQVCVSKKKEAENGLGANMVKKITRTIVRKINDVYCDNFFIKFSLFQDLLHDKIYACVTIFSHRKFFPKQLKSFKKRF